MDNYDILKKLSKGLTFKNRILGEENNVFTPKKEEMENVEIKEEPFSEDEVLSGDEISANSNEDSGEEWEANKEQTDKDIELIYGVQVGHIKKKVKSEDFKKKLELEEVFMLKQEVKKEEIENVEIKEEPFIEDEVLSGVEISASSSEGSGEEWEANEKQIDKDIELIDGVKVGHIKKKKKKKVKSEDLKKKLELEEQNHFRNEYGIKAVGRHVPAALGDFDELVPQYNVAQGLVDIVKDCGYSEPTPVQRQAIPCMLEDRQIFACAPTGSGKTAAFLLPLLHTLGAPQGGPRALILCPTRELAQQVYRDALWLSASTQLKCSILRDLKESNVKEKEATFKKSDIVISTPNRLCYLLNQDSVNITLEKVRWLIIDAADKVIEGSSGEESEFRHQLEQIMRACDSKQRRIAMFSATHTPVIAKWCSHNNMRGLLHITVGHRNAATNLVDQELLFCGNENGKLVAFKQLVQKGLKLPVLVFVQSKDRAKQLFKELIYDGINVDVIHADRTQAQRDNVVRSFLVGRIWMLICTELLGRGIDFRGVNHVINYDFPPSAISYIYRIGQVGRAGQKGYATTFFTQDDVVNLRSIASVMKQSGCHVPDYMLALKQDANKRENRRARCKNRNYRKKQALLRDMISTRLENRPEKFLRNARQTPDVQ